MISVSQVAAKVIKGVLKADSIIKVVPREDWNQFLEALKLPVEIETDSTFRTTEEPIDASDVDPEYEEG